MMFLSVWTKIGKYTRYSSWLRGEVAVSRIACQIRAVGVNIWYLKQLGFRLSFYDVVQPTEGRSIDTAGSKDPGELHARYARWCTPYAPSSVIHAQDAQ